MCGKVGEEVHHKIYLTPTNVDNLAISTNSDNPIYLCKECHNKIHEHFDNRKEYKFDENGDLVIK